MKVPFKIYDVVTTWKDGSPAVASATVISATDKKWRIKIDPNPHGSGFRHRTVIDANSYELSPSAALLRAATRARELAERARNSADSLDLSADAMEVLAGRVEVQEATPSVSGKN